MRAMLYVFLRARRGVCFCARMRDGLIRPGTDRRYHAIAQSRDCRDVGGLLGVVAEQAAERSHGLVDRVRSDDDVGPDLVEQVIDTDDLAGVLGEAEQQSHGTDLYPSGLSVSRNLTRRRIDAPGADAKHCGGWAFHAGSVMR